MKSKKLYTGNLKAACVYVYVYMCVYMVVAHR
jgi:hypothetical protein